MFDLITIGDCTCDTFLDIDNATLHYDKKSHRPKKLCLPYGEKIAIKSLFGSVGGSAANVAVGGRRLGLQTAIVSEIGQDTLSELIVESLKKNKVTLSFLKRNKKRKTRYSVILNFKGERTILSYFDPEPYTLLSFPATKYIYYTSLGASFEVIQNTLEQYLKKHPHAKLMCNPGTYQLQSRQKTWQKILPHTSLLFVNKEEAETLCNKKGNISFLLQTLRQKGAKTVVLTDGVLGSHASNGKEKLSLGIFPTPIVSKTGAGDAYASGFIAAFVKGRRLRDCMIQGTANAAAVTAHLGAQTGLLNNGQIKKFISTHKLN